ncbi:hypothetical protein CEXT_631761, partial [Caerostris extrusa]
MEITKCKFCNAYITNFEVHNCMRFGNQHRRTSATLPQCSSGNVAEDIELITAEEMEDEALWPFVKQSDSSTLNQINQPLNQINNSRQQSIFSDIHQGIDCEETAATEMASQYGDTNQNSYNPSDYETGPSETSDYLFPDMHYIQENDLISTHLQLFPEVSNVFNNQNPQNYESSNSEQPEDTAMSVATQCVLPGFKQTYVNCEKNSEEKSLGRTSCTFQNTDAPQKTKNHLHESSKCSMEFRQKDYLHSHERCHNVEKSYICSFCDKAFTRSDNLDVHIRTHTGEKPYVCNFCNKAFTRSDGLRKHIRTHTGEKPYVCNFCNKAFTRTDALGVHIRTHTGEKPYSCTECGKCYPYRSSLTKHVRTIHAGESPDPRSECDESCANNSLRKCRMPKHAGEERSKCDSCGAEFSSEESLEVHKCKED